MWVDVAALVVASAAAWKCKAPPTDKFAWVEESSGGLVAYTTVSHPRAIYTGGEKMENGMYMSAFCTESKYVANYTCIIKCDDGKIDWQHCGPGGTEGKGEKFGLSACVKFDEALINQCDVDFTSEEKTQKWTSLVYPYEEKEQSLKEFVEIATEYMLNTMLDQFDKKVTLTHADSNIVRLGFLAGTNNRRSVDLNQGLYIETTTDYYARECARRESQNDTSLYLPLVWDKEFNVPLVLGCPEEDGYVDILGPTTVFTMTSSDATLEAAANFGWTYDAGTHHLEEFLNDWDPSEADGDVFYPGIAPELGCVLHNTIDADVCVSGALLPVSTKKPEGYKFDIPVMTVISAIDYDVCAEPVEPPDATFLGIDKNCFYMHQAGWHLRNGQMFPIYPILLNGEPDFFGVCDTFMLDKAKFLPNLTHLYDFPVEGYWWDPTSTNADPNVQRTFDAARAAGFAGIVHSRSWGIHICYNPDDNSVFVCTFNAAFENFQNMGDFQLLSPLTFLSEPVTDAANLCEQKQAHWCPFDDFWFQLNASTVDLVYTEGEFFGSPPLDKENSFIFPRGEAAFKTAQQACMADPDRCWDYLGL